MKTKYHLIKMFLLAAGLLSLGTTTRSQTFSLIHTFTNLPDGQNPFARLTLSGNVLYGATGNGGSFNCGTLFKINTDGTGYTVVKNFAYAPNDGNNPIGELLLSGGVLYGTTKYGGSYGLYGNGTVFKVNTDGTGYSVLKSFTNSPDGQYPLAGLTLLGNVLYGTTTQGGSGGSGTLFKINTDGTGYAVIKNLSMITNNTNTDGATPQAGLTISGGLLYGTTYSGGSFGVGTVFKVNPDGTGYTVLKNFTNSPDGAYPNAALTLASGVLYGTTVQGGNFGRGTVFKINPDGTGYTVLKSFTNSPDGAFPYAGLTLSGGVLYGTTAVGGSNNVGTVFSVNTDGTEFAVLKTFSKAINNTNSDGGYPEAGVTFSGSALYGTTVQAGTLGNGTLFKIDLGGSAPALGISTYGNQPAVFYPTATGTNFVLQMSTNLTSGSWVTVSNGIPFSCLVISNAPANAFFRLH